MNLKKVTLTKVSLFCSLVGIALLYTGAVHMRPGLTPIANIDNDFVGTKAKVSGKVVDVQEHSEGHLFLELEDNSGGSISVPIFSDILSKIKENIEILDRVQIKGRIKRYRGEFEILPERAESVRFVKSPPLDLSKVEKSKVGETVKVRGFVIRKIIFKSEDVLLKIRRGDDHISLFAPCAAVKERDISSIREGDLIQAIGKVQMYKGRPQIKIGGNGKINLIEAL